MHDYSEAELRARMSAELPPALMAHVDRVVAITDTLAQRWDLDVALARMMAQAHDVVRHLGDEEWLQRAEAYGIPIDPVDRVVPVLLHGQVGAEELRRRYGITDERVLNAVWWHTSGHHSYPPEAWAMFIADKVDPKKAARWDELNAVHYTARERGLKPAALQYLELRLREAMEEGYLMHPSLLATRNYLLGRLPAPD